ncbi:helix-turn-helix domain-containing protein [Natrarchaeobius chitinivorans]|uniref:MarR family transcriptional regulator n=1 Tax=Natrarchaeobius chitinivorans TaxID=1679083 RepID=A0A3N6NA87_NATCH|nr:helix-turn-helix domain-containing protein [Natrarchaeobius chitinivorans]RQG95512.1 MarR family transcriptional regulator [Natrarchaeobius chitinivorans]
MSSSVTDQLNRNMQCESLLECLYGLKPLDRQCYGTMVESDGPLTVDEIAVRVGRERSTAYRSIKRLHQRGLLEKEQINYDDGGYYHVYYPTDPTVVTREMQRTLSDWYAKMGTLVREFEDTYDDAHEALTDDDSSR